jgi:hypothetical protein
MSILNNNKVLEALEALLAIILFKRITNPYIIL